MNPDNKNSTAIKSATATSIASLFVAGAVDASIIYNTMAFDVTDANLSFSWNIDGMGDAEARFDSFGSFTIDLYSNANNFGIIQGIVRNANTTTTTLSSLGAQNLPTGFLVNAMLPTNYTFFNSVLSIANNGGGLNTQGFTDGQSGFIGFQFNPDGTTLFGWAEVTFQEGGTRGQITVSRWAYEDSGAGIEVGAIPELETAPVALGVLALGAAGLRRWRGGKASA